eukprot:SAG31_NODE_21418_length_543_cov_0.984479_1_plen_71_part_10
MQSCARDAYDVHSSELHALTMQHPVGVQVRAVAFSFLCPLLEKCGTFIARCNALIEKVSTMYSSVVQRATE